MTEFKVGDHLLIYELRDSSGPNGPIMTTKGLDPGLEADIRADERWTVIDAMVTRIDGKDADGKEAYDPNHYDEAPCARCGHSYIRHFDWMENHDHVGCKYCECEEFKEKVEK